MGNRDKLTEPDGSEIRARRERLGLSQTQLAEESGVGISTIQIAELNRRPISARSANRIDIALSRMEDRPGEDLLRELRGIRAYVRGLASDLGSLEARIEALEARQ